MRRRKCDPPADTPAAPAGPPLLDLAPAKPTGLQALAPCSADEDARSAGPIPFPVPTAPTDSADAGPTPALPRPGDDRMTGPDVLAPPTNETEALRQQLLQAQRLSSVGALASSVAHEVHKLLTTIINYAKAGPKG